jgi:putative endonuclease
VTTFVNHAELVEARPVDFAHARLSLYILRCADGSYYVGSTSNLELRLAGHRAGESDYTARRLPVKLVFSQGFPSPFEAFVVERQVKGWSRAKKEALVEGRYEDLPPLSWSRNRRPSTSSGDDLV